MTHDQKVKKIKNMYQEYKVTKHQDLFNNIIAFNLEDEEIIIYDFVSYKEYHYYIEDDNIEIIKGINTIEFDLNIDEYLDELNIEYDDELQDYFENLLTYPEVKKWDKIIDEFTNKFCHQEITLTQSLKQEIVNYLNEKLMQPLKLDKIKGYKEISDGQFIGLIINNQPQRTLSLNIDEHNYLSIDDDVNG